MCRSKSTFSYLQEKLQIYEPGDNKIESRGKRLKRIPSLFTAINRESLSIILSKAPEVAAPDAFLLSPNCQKQPKRKKKNQNFYFYVICLPLHHPNCRLHY
ncbi:hypothetical protein CXB51_027841 [Gossypium anomalum]|uniref:Uncharacterized protein n=1 Tax=Gossypium anomalum TaxID=47600 RepID=A0A8J5YDK7_9ROSI|nr:hypothetical protein CXB51_027841 [Gossypium anomalum]